MFSKWINLLLKFFDYCGFCTELNSINQKYVIVVYLLRFLWAFVSTCIVVIFLMQPVQLDDDLPYFANTMVQYMGGTVTYWVIIIESFAKRKVQRKFWRIYKSIEHRHNQSSKKSFFNTYLVKLIEYSTIMLPIHIYFLSYFITYVGNFFFFRLAYLVFMCSYQYRVFFFLFYLQLIKRELNAIKYTLNDIETRTYSVSLSLYFGERVNEFAVLPNESKSFCENQLKIIHKHYREICELNYCINNIFGWSHFVTILYCFLLLLTDVNWAYTEMQHKPTIYIYGKFKFNFNFCFS